MPTLTFFTVHRTLVLPFHSPCIRTLSHVSRFLQIQWESKETFIQVIRPSSAVTENCPYPEVILLRCTQGPEIPHRGGRLPMAFDRDWQRWNTRINGQRCRRERNNRSHHPGLNRSPHLGLPLLKLKTRLYILSDGIELPPVLKLQANLRKQREG